MKKAFISTVSLALVFSMALSFASCDGDDDATKENTSTTTEATQTNAPQATEGETENATDAQTDTPDESEPIEDTATNAAVTDAPVTDAPITNSPATTPETKAPAKDTTKMPETSAPIEDTTSSLTTAPEKDPDVDYSEGEENDFEKLLPVPLPFTDKTEWLGEQLSDRKYVLFTKDYMWTTSEEKEYCLKIIEEFAYSFTQYGYSVRIQSNNSGYWIFDETGYPFVTINSDRVFSIIITYR